MRSSRALPACSSRIAGLSPPLLGIFTIAHLRRHNRTFLEWFLQAGSLPVLEGFGGFRAGSGWGWLAVQPSRSENTMLQAAHSWEQALCNWGQSAAVSQQGCIG